MNTTFSINVLFDLLFGVLFDVIGLVGVACYVTGFVGLQMYNWQPQSYRYLICNALGATLTLISLIFAFNLAAFVSQIIWLAISVFSIAKTTNSRRTLPNPTAEEPTMPVNGNMTL